MRYRRIRNKKEQQVKTRKRLWKREAIGKAR